MKVLTIYEKHGGALNRGSFFSRAKFAPPVMKGGDFVKSFIARSSRQLDRCLRLLYAEHTEFIVKVKETERRKIMYEILVETDEQTYRQLKEKYRILIS